MSDDKWLDEVLDRTEKEEILDNIKRALDYLDDMDVRKAYNVLETLAHSMDGYDVEIENVSEFEENLKKSIAESWDCSLDDPTDPSYIPPEMHSHSFDGTYTTVDPMADLKVGLEEMKKEILRLREEQQYSKDRILEYVDTAAATRPLNQAERAARHEAPMRKEYIEMLLGRKK